MLRAGVNDPTNPMILIGLSDGNIERLKAGQPIKASLRSFGVDLPGHFAIVHGHTEADLEAMLRRHGLIDEHTKGSVDPAVGQANAIDANFDKILIVTVGLPCSGKSTWARRQTYPVVNPDSIRLAMHGQRFAAPAEPFVWASARLMVRALFLSGHRKVVVDATNMSRERRDEWRSASADDGWATFFHVIETPVEVCLARAAAENDKEIIPVIERMAASWEPLGDDEARWPS